MRPRNPGRGLPYFILLLGLAATAAMASYVHRSTRARDRERFLELVEQVRQGVERRLGPHVAVLRGAAALFAASDTVTAAEFRRFAEEVDLPRRYPGALGIGYSILVPARRDSALVQAMRRDVAPDFRLTPSQAPGERHAIVFLEPLDRRNRVALGYDMYADSVRRTAIDRARREGRAVTSGRISLVQEIDGRHQPGFLIVLPVYRNGEQPITPEERRAAFVGVVYSPFRADDVLGRLFAHTPVERLDLRVYDGPRPDSTELLHDSRAFAGRPPAASAPEFSRATLASVPGGVWTIVVDAPPGFRASDPWAPLVLFAGSLISIVLFLVTRAQSRFGAELRVSESRFRSLVEQSVLSTQVLDPGGRTVLVNRAWERLWGTTLEQLGDYDILADPQLEAHGILALLRRAFAGEPVSLPAVGYVPDRGAYQGIQRWVRAFAYPVKRVDGVISEIVLVHEDISERRQAEERLRYQLDLMDTITQNAEDALFLMDAQARVTFLNPAAERLLGWSREQLLGRILHDTAHARRPDGTTVSLAECALCRVFRTGETVRNHQDVFFRRDGSTVPVVCSNAPIIREGRVTSTVLVVVDDTERRQAEEVRTRLAAIVESSDDAIIGKRLDGTVESWNAAAERMFGYAASDIVGRSILLILPPERRMEEEEHLTRVAAGGLVTQMETVRLAKGGRRIDVSLSIFPVRSGGEITGAATVMRDITDRKRRDEALRHTQKLESIGVLAGGIAHDFNNLLTGIMGNASLALHMIPPEAGAADLLEDVLRASERAADLTNQLLAYAGKGRFFIAPVDVSRLVRGITSLILSSIPKKVRLRLDTATGLPPVEADASQLQQLVMNLVLNGAEAVGDGAGEVTVMTRARTIAANEASREFPAFDLAPGEYVEITVEDTGGGMDDATLRHIFDPFFTTKFMGRGLGLAAALGIVRGHQGGIAVQSRPGWGTRFTVVLPASSQPAPAEPSPPPPPVRAGRGAGRTILVADDEEIVRAAAAGALRAAGYEVLEAANGQEAVDLFRAEADRIALVLLDMTMPVVAGAEAIPLLRAIRADVPIIASSGYGELEAAARLTGRGVEGFLPKPYAADRLVAMVARTLDAD
jgi:PAS domain S-box-containing protein